MGKKYKYTCEHCKNAPNRSGFRRNYKWKTERGFDNHPCYKDEKLLTEQRQKRQEEKDAFDLKEAKRTAEHKIGSEIHFVGYSITKPTHVWRGTRMVHVRYEEERSYWNDSGIVEEITIHGYKVKGRDVSSGDIFETKEKTYEKAKEYGTNYKEKCAFASRCR